MCSGGQQCSKPPGETFPHLVAFFSFSIAIKNPRSRAMSSDFHVFAAGCVADVLQLARCYVSRITWAF